MIYLADHKLLFVKPHKTASTSVEIALSCAAGPADIVTPLIPEDELIRSNTGGRMPVNWAWYKPTEARYLRDFEHYRLSGVIPKRFLPGGNGKLYSKLVARYYNHMTPDMVERRARRGLLDNSFMVTMVRHPYEQLVSWAWHQKSMRYNQQSLSEVVDHALSLPAPNDAYLFHRKAPDFVIRYELMAEDLTELGERICFDLISKLPLTKNVARGDRKTASETLTPAQKKLCQIRDSRIFKKFGYEA